MTEHGVSTTFPPLTIGALHRWSVIERLLSNRDDIVSIVEVGCGQGALSCRLAVDHDYRGYEPDGASFRVASERLSRFDRAEVREEELPSSPDRQFDALVAFEVLEHLDQDQRAARAWVDWIRPGGSMLVSVPSNPDRFGPWDEAVGHLRRYTRSSLRSVLESAGLIDVRMWATGMPLGYATEAVRNRVAPSPSDSRQNATRASGRRLQPTGGYWPLVELAVKPFVLAQRLFVDSDYGTGLVALASKP